MIASFYQEVFLLYSSRSYKLHLNLGVVSWKELLEEYSMPSFYRNNIIIWGVVCIRNTEQYLYLLFCLFLFIYWIVSFKKSFR